MCFCVVLCLVHVYAHDVLCVCVFELMLPGASYVSLPIADLFLCSQAVEDFREALALDPDNAELTKLMHTAREKYLEVAGTSFGEEGAVRVESSGDVEVQEMARPVSSDGVSSKEEEEVLLVQLVADSAELLLPPVDAVLLKAGNLSAGSNFVRINVVSDDETESDEEEEEEAGGGEGPPVAYNRIAIVDESDSEGADDGNEDGSNSDSDSAEQREQRATELKERGNLLLKQGDAVGAVEAYTAALSFLPSHTPSLNNRAQAHLALKVYVTFVAIIFLSRWSK